MTLTVFIVLLEHTFHQMVLNRLELWGSIAKDSELIEMHLTLPTHLSLLVGALEVLIEMKNQDVKFNKDTYVLAFAICYKLVRLSFLNF